MPVTWYWVTAPRFSRAVAISTAIPIAVTISTTVVRRVVVYLDSLGGWIGFILVACGGGFVSGGGFGSGGFSGVRGW